MVNQVEQPFSRSLAACDEPVTPGNFTGSRWCGDRLHVINDGYRLNAIGQSQESFAQLCSVILVTLVVGAVGRKSALLLGLGGTTMSVVLFVVASTNLEMGRRLYAYGQGLQGLYPMDYLWGIIQLDLSSQRGADGMMAYQIGASIGIASSLVWQAGFGSIVPFLELVDYGPVWLCILVVNVCVLLIAVVFMPETKPTSEDEAADTRGVFARMVGEALSYANMVFDFRARRFVSFKLFEHAYLAPMLPLVGAQMLAFHGFSQATITSLQFVMQCLMLLLMPLFPFLTKTFGYYGMFIRTLPTFVFCMVGCLLSTTIPGVGGVVCVLLIIVVFPVFHSYQPFVKFLESKYCEPAQLQRFNSAQWLIGYFIMTVVGPLTASLFDAKAPTYFGKTRVNFFLVGCHIAHQSWGIMFLYKITDSEGWYYTLTHLDDGKKLLERVMSVLPKCTEVKPHAAILTQEIWKASGLQEVLGEGRSVEECGGPFWNMEHLGGFVMSAYPVTLQGLVKCEEAVECVDKWAAGELGEEKWAAVCEELPPMPPSVRTDEAKKEK